MIKLCFYDVANCLCLRTHIECVRSFLFSKLQTHPAFLARQNKHARTRVNREQLW